MKPLTNKQRAIYEFIIQETAKNFFQPSLNEIKEAFGLATHQGVIVHLKALEKKGYIKRTGEARALIIYPYSKGILGV